MLVVLVIGLTAGFIAGLAPAPLGGLRTGLAYGLYAVGVSCAKARERLPFHLESFMEWACDSGLLRIAGTGYQFRHRQLQDSDLRGDLPVS